ncbi:hypothetical protein EV356DRAFT_497667 [Viridothelium virens]|uniref:Putative transcription factor kapC n=1 Tax=Viridothelium virens TaxID=1048519 RepID=A0A6A6HFP6_VIRVR|nr:hypothetical protein EV356DRAFT_497667 [Viridothelium virens]
MNNLQLDQMWDDGSDIHSKRSWSDLTDVIILSEPELSAYTSSTAQRDFDFLSTDQSNAIYGSCESPPPPPSSHVPLPSISASPTVISSPDLSPVPMHDYSSSFNTSPVRSTHEEMKMESQKNNSRSSARRRDQNRAAQRAFRERREQHLKSLEARVHGTEERYRELQRSYQKLEGIHHEAKQTIERQTIELSVFRSIVKCNHRSCECINNGSINNGEAEPCISNVASKEPLQGNDCTKMKEERSSLQND